MELNPVFEHIADMRQRLYQQFPRAVANLVVDLLLGHQRQIKLGERIVHCIRDLGRGFDQGTVEIEEDQVIGRGHASNPFTDSATLAEVMPKYWYKSLAGADSPKVSMPITAPVRPTYLRQKSG